jgi:hypothetical protein
LQPYLLWLVLLAAALTGCRPASSPTAAEADRLFREAVRKRALTVERVDADGLYVIKLGEVEVKVSLDNAIKEYTRDKDPGAFDRLAAQVTATQFEFPKWESARKSLRLVVSPHDMPFNETVHERITDRMHQVLAFDRKDSIAWIGQDQLKEWGVTREQALAAASDNLKQMMAKATITSEDVLGEKLVIIETEPHFKSSLILAPNFAQVMARHLKGPLYAVAPARDFIYVFSSENPDLVKRIGGVVLEEFESSPHPVTSELLRIENGKIRAVGEFAKRQ